MGSSVQTTACNTPHSIITLVINKRHIRELSTPDVNKTIQITYASISSQKKARMFGGRNRTCSESSEGDHQEVRPQSPSLIRAALKPDAKVGYDLEGKFTYSQVANKNSGEKMKTTVDENGKFTYKSADMHPVPPGWYNVDKSKFKVPLGWYDASKK